MYLFYISLVLLVLDFILQLIGINGLMLPLNVILISFFYINSNIKNTIYLKIMLLGVIFVIVGSFAKLTHQPFASILIMMSILWLALVYIVYFFTKKIKNTYEVLKVVAFVTFCISITFNILHWPYSSILIWINFTMFFVLIILQLENKILEMNSKIGLV